MSEKKTRAFFIAQCGDKYVYEFEGLHFRTAIWYTEPTKYKTKDELLIAIGLAMQCQSKPNGIIEIKEVIEQVAENTAKKGFRQELDELLSKYDAKILTVGGCRCIDKDEFHFHICYTKKR